MGFWDSLVEGAKAAGGWVIDHAGDVANAVGTVAKIAGTFIVLEDFGDADHQSHLEDFHNNFRIASHKLQQRAEKAASIAALQADRRINANNFAVDNVVLDSVIGIWRNPVPLSREGEPTISMYQDVSKWLATLGVPANASVDVAFSVAKALFVGTNSTAVNTIGDNPITVTSYSYTDPEGHWTLDCGHAFYPLPLGASADDKVWHSCIHARFHPSISHVTEKRQQKRPTAFVNGVKTGTLVWMINATINWGNAAVASTAYDDFIKNCQDAVTSESDRSVVSSNLTGVSQFVQIQGGSNDNPSILRQILIECAAKTMSSQSATLGNGGHVAGHGTQGHIHGTEGSYDDDHAPPVKRRISHGAAHKPLLAGSSTGASAMPLLMPEITVTKSQLIFVASK
ncbi:hypothetical protein G7054_g10984 [Neopestalotiopsis clavispora]|nr:hypothetical protein G7054_g10984 [Neopestalotiopsis clavispora]